MRKYIVAELNNNQVNLKKYKIVGAENYNELNYKMDGIYTDKRTHYLILGYMNDDYSMHVEKNALLNILGTDMSKLIESVRKSNQENASDSILKHVIDLKEGKIKCIERSNLVRIDRFNEYINDIKKSCNLIDLDFYKLDIINSNRGIKISINPDRVLIGSINYKFINGSIGRLYKTNDFYEFLSFLYRDFKNDKYIFKDPGPFPNNRSTVLKALSLEGLKKKIEMHYKFNSDFIEFEKNNKNKED